MGVVGVPASDPASLSESLLNDLILVRKLDAVFLENILGDPDDEIKLPLSSFAADRLWDCVADD